MESHLAPYLGRHAAINRAVQRVDVAVGHLTANLKLKAPFVGAANTHNHALASGTAPGGSLASSAPALSCCSRVTWRRS